VSPPLAPSLHAAFSRPTAALLAPLAIVLFETLPALGLPIPTASLTKPAGLPVSSGLSVAPGLTIPARLTAGLSFLFPVAPTKASLLAAAAPPVLVTPEAASILLALTEALTTAMLLAAAPTRFVARPARLRAALFDIAAEVLSPLPFRTVVPAFVPATLIIFPAVLVPSPSIVRHVTLH
jgi:hypothetical protein